MPQIINYLEQYETGLVDSEGNVALAVDNNGNIISKAFNSKNIKIGLPCLRLRYMHWNIGHFAKGNNSASTITAETYETQKTAFRNLFALYNADICGFCEWSSNFYGTKKASDEVLSLYPYHYVAPTESGYVGTSLHSTFELSNLTEINFDVQSNNRAYEAVFHCNGNKIIICECHLPWSSQADHDKAQNILFDRYANEKYVIIGGDFNFFVGDASHTPYHQQYEQWANAGYFSANCNYQGDILTSYNNVTCTNYLDSIFVKGGTILQTKVHQVTPEGKDKDNPLKDDELLWDEVNLSDHFPVISDIVFNFKL